MLYAIRSTFFASRVATRRFSIPARPILEEQQKRLAMLEQEVERVASERLNHVDVRVAKQTELLARVTKIEIILRIPTDNGNHLATRITNIETLLESSISATSEGEGCQGPSEYG